jgi:large subunit ribosomal protein L24
MGTIASSRRKFYAPAQHRRKDRLMVHVDKETGKKLGIASRSVLVRKGDTVKVARGKYAGKSGQVLSVNYIKGTFDMEGITRTNSRTKKEVAVAIEPSNVVLVARGDIKALAKRQPKKKEQPKEQEPQEAKGEGKAQTKEQPAKEPKAEKAEGAGEGKADEAKQPAKSGE